MQEIKLFAPNGLPIIGALADNGTLRTFKYSYDRATESSWYEMDEGPPLFKGAITLQDSAGQRWSTTDVEWYTLFERK